MVLIRILLIGALVYLLIKWLTKSIAKHYLKKFMQQGHQDIDKLKKEAKNNEGKIIILNQEQQQKKNSEDGEFIDYEEIK